MAKTATGSAVTVQPDKKQAKREAKLKLKMEEVRKSIQKAERKATKAQSDVDTLKGQLHELHELLGHNQQEAEGEQAQPGVETPEVEHEALEALHLASPPPGEAITTPELAEQEDPVSHA